MNIVHTNQASNYYSCSIDYNRSLTGCGRVNIFANVCVNYKYSYQRVISMQSKTYQQDHQIQQSVYMSMLSIA